MQASGTSCRRHREWISWTLLVLTLLPGTVVAQSTRTEQLEQQRALRAQTGAPEPARFEKIMLRAEDRWLQPRALPSQGTFYPRMGSVTVGGLLGFGAGYRRSFVNDNLRCDASGILTLRGYFLGHAELSIPRLVRRTFEVKGIAEYRHFPQEDFYGLGPDSTKAQQTNYSIDQPEYAVQAIWRPRSWLQVGSRSAWLEPRLGEGTDKHVPSIGTRFTEADAPGLTAPTTFFEQGGLAVVDYRDAPGDAHRGGRYVVYGSRYHDRRDRGFDFSRVTVHLEQYVPVFDSKRVLGFRLALNRFDADAGSQVPFYYLVPFGGGDSVRSFDDLRFRDADSWIISSEYRWEVLTRVGMALFYDRGGVAPRVNRLSIVHAVQAYGIAARLTTGQAIFLRAEAALGGEEGLRGFVGFSAPMKVERFLR